MELIINGSESFNPADVDTIEHQLRGLAGEGDSFAVLSRSDMYYMQTQGGASIGFLLEYQDGSLEKHYRCTNADLGVQDVILAFSSYLNGDNRWRHDFEWEIEDLSAYPQPRSASPIMVGVGVLVTAYLVWKFFIAA